MTKSKTFYKKNHEYTGTLPLDADLQPVTFSQFFASKTNVG